MKTPLSVEVAEFCARTRRLREVRGFTQKQMAAALGISTDAYRKNETRSPLPHHLIARFSAIVGRSVEFVMTGSDSRPPSNPSRPRKIS